MRNLHRFLADDRGSQTVEFVMWVPFIVSLMLVVMDASVLYVTHSDMWTIARDTARRMTANGAGSLTPQEAIGYASSRISQHNFIYNVEANYVSGPAAEVVITLNVASKSFVGLAMLGGTMSARVVMRQG